MEKRIKTLEECVLTLTKAQRIELDTMKEVMNSVKEVACALSDSLKVHQKKDLPQVNQSEIQKSVLAIIQDIQTDDGVEINFTFRKLSDTDKLTKVISIQICKGDDMDDESEY